MAPGSGRTVGGAFTELDIGVPPPVHWARRLDPRWHARVRLLYCRPEPGSTRRVARLFEVAADPSSAAELGRFLREAASPGVLAPSPTDPGRWLVSVVETAEPRCRIALSSGGFCLVCPLVSPELPTGEVTWRLLVPRRGRTRRGLRRLGAAVGAPGSQSRIMVVHPYLGPHRLTERQRHALETASRLGYFSVPRRANLAAVAAALGVRRSTALEHIRKGLDGIIARRLPDWASAGDAPGEDVRPGPVPDLGPRGAGPGSRSRSSALR